MPISYQEPAQLTCPSCSADFSASIWMILDALEEPAAVDQLLRGELNTVQCPSCGDNGPAGAPLLFHDGPARMLIFTPTPGAAEHELRDQARELHAVLVGSIPEEQRRPYLADVDIAQDLEGMARKIQRAARRRPGGPLVPPAAPPAPAASEQPPELLQAVEALLSANSADELQAVITQHPQLLDPATDAMLAALAEVARDQRSSEVADGLQQARRLLHEMRAVTPAALPIVAPAELPIDAVQSLLNAVNAVELAAVAAAHPQLLHPQADQLLAIRVEAALDEGNERLAQALEERREALIALRIAPAAEPPVAEPPAAAIDESMIDEAIEALLIADGEEAMVAVIDRYPLLLDPVAEQALWAFAAEARAGGDEDLARYAIECRELLRRVRAGLSDGA